MFFMNFNLRTFRKNHISYNFFNNDADVLIAVLTLHWKKFKGTFFFFSKIISNGQTTWMDPFKINIIQKLLTIQLLSYMY